MKTLRAVLGFLFSFAVAWVVIFTFTQEPFKAAVPARLFTYATPAIPIYQYVLGAFVIGLVLGLGSTVFTYLRMTGQVSRSRREARELSDENTRLRASLGLSDSDGEQTDDSPAGHENPPAPTE